MAGATGRRHAERRELEFQVAVVATAVGRGAFDSADRGFVAALSPAVVRADGRVVWDSDSYAFLAQECPDTAHPSLWRQGQLCVKQGLYEVTDCAA